MLLFHCDFRKNQACMVEVYRQREGIIVDDGLPCPGHGLRSMDIVYHNALWRLGGFLDCCYAA